MITMKKRTFAIILSVVLAVGILIGRSSLQAKMTPSLSQMFRIFTAVIYMVQTHYIDELTPEELVERAIKGMVSSLDPFSEFYTPEETEDFMVHTKGKFGGVGMEVGLRDGWLTVISPIEGTPAYRAGLRAGDRIIKIDGEPTWGLTLNEAVKKIRGKPGTKVVLTVVRPGLNEPIDFEIVREVIVIHPVRHFELVNGEIGYIRFVTFSENSSQELKQIVDSLIRLGAKKFILDLRSNPGGQLREAVEVVDMFLPPGRLIVSTKGRQKGTEEQFLSIHDPLIDTTAPLVVLIDGGSASASEIVAGAIQDWDRGVLIGDTTVGKGSVQRLFQLENNYTLKLTIARYYTPSGRCIDKVTWKNKRRAPLIEAPESLKVKEQQDTTGEEDTLTFYTKKLHRKVRGGGGIIPDIVMEREKILPFVSKLVAKGAFFNFAIQYVEEHPDTPRSVDDLKLTKSDIADFRKFIEKKGIKYKKGEFMDAEDQIVYLLKLEIADKYWGIKARYHISLQRDKVFQKAVELLSKVNNTEDLMQKVLVN